ncbi:MAG: EAL domain-containing protein [Gammaproteobacteria bacterium]|nr:EAL domain-containing protein [Gammaproteobacteria bacterium]
MLQRNLILQAGTRPSHHDLTPFKRYKSILIQVFAATSNKKLISETLNYLSENLPQAIIIGASSDGTIDRGTLHAHGDVIQLAISCFEKTRIKLSVIEHIETSFDAGVQIADQCSTNDTKVLIAFSEAHSINGEEFLEGIFSTNKQLIIAGGVASTPTFTDTFIIAGNNIYDSGAVAASLSGEGLHAFRDHSFGWQTIGKEMIITEANNNCIKSIDGKTPSKIFRKYLGDTVVEAMPGVGSAFPLMVKRGNHYIARGIIAVEGEYFIVSGNIKDNDRVYIGYGNPHSIAHQNQLTDSVLSKIGSPEAIFAYYCEGRRLFMPEHMVEYELSNLEQIGPVSGFFTLGEFYTEQQYLLLNFSSTLLVLSESESIEPDINKTFRPPPPTRDIFELISEGLFHLIDTRTKELNHQTYHDEITGLPNRIFFNEILGMAIQSSTEHHNLLAVLYIDLDNFHTINDTQGHKVGDQLLQLTANKIKSILPSGDVLSHHAADEFVALHQTSENINQITTFCTKILELFKDPFTLDGNEIHLSASIGISMFPEDGLDQETLIKHADAAMYKVKHSGKKNFSFYHHSITDKVMGRLSMETDLRKAINDNQLIIHYQPQINLKTGKIVSAEALVRWQHPKKGLILPDHFIGLAEETGLIIPLGEIVFDKVLGQMREWLNKGLNLSKISINVSAKQFNHEDMLATTTKYLNKYALPPKYLDIEITESAIMHDSEMSLKKLAELQHYGATISIDDFGTGYSSLNYLKQFSVNTLKIDKTFIDNIPNDENDVAITEAIIALAKSMNLDIVAEGIETSEHERFLIYHNCTLGQGYYYSHPVPGDVFEKLYANWKSH